MILEALCIGNYALISSWLDYWNVIREGHECCSSFGDWCRLKTHLFRLEYAGIWVRSYSSVLPHSATLGYILVIVICHDASNVLWNVNRIVNTCFMFVHPDFIFIKCLWAPGGKGPIPMYNHYHYLKIKKKIVATVMVVQSAFRSKILLILKVWNGDNKKNILHQFFYLFYYLWLPIRITWGP